MSRAELKDWTNRLAAKTVSSGSCPAMNPGSSLPARRSRYPPPSQCSSRLVVRAEQEPQKEKKQLDYGGNKTLRFWWRVRFKVTPKTMTLGWALARNASLTDLNMD